MLSVVIVRAYADDPVTTEGWICRAGITGCPAGSGARQQRDWRRRL